jgi:hypothetical protein
VIRRLFLGLLTLGGLAVVLVGGVALGFFIYARLIFGFSLKDQPALIKLPPSFNASVKATNNVTIQLNGFIDATVPFKQTLQLPVEGDYDTDIVLDTVVPLQFTIVYKGLIPVDTIADIHGRTDFLYQNVKRLRNVAFAAKIPLKFEQPVSFTVPVNTKLHLVYRGPLRLKLNQTIAAPVDTVLHTRIKAVREITTPILARFDLRVHAPTDPIPAFLTRSDLRLRLDSLRLSKTDDPNKPTREDTATTTENKR